MARATGADSGELARCRVANRELDQEMKSLNRMVDALPDTSRREQLRQRLADAAAEQAKLDRDLARLVKQHRRFERLLDAHHRTP